MLLLLLFIAIQAADVWTTFVALGRGAEEANLLPAFLFRTVGFWPSVLAIKAAGMACAAAATFALANGYWFTGVLDVIGAGVLVNNLLVIRAQSR